MEPLAKLMSLDVALAQSPYVLLDANILILDFNQSEALIGSDLPIAARRTSMVVLWEFLHGRQGARLGEDLVRQRRQWLDDKQIYAKGLPTSHFATFNNVMRMERGPSSAADAIIATEALCRGWPIYTRNVRDFEGVPGLSLVVETSKTP